MSPSYHALLDQLGLNGTGVKRGPASSATTAGTEHPNSPPSKKRTTTTASNGSSSSSVHPFFTSKPTTSGNFVASPSTVCHFLHLDPFASSPSSSLAAAGPAASSSTVKPEPPKVEVVFYDLDGTLIKTRTGGDFPSSRSDWTWWHPDVPARLKQEWAEGKHVVVLSNQGDARDKVRTEWKAKLPLIAAKVGGVSISSHFHASRSPS